MKATSTQVGIIVEIKVYKGLEIQWSDLTCIHGVLDKHEPHITVNNSFCNIKKPPLEQLMASFGLKNVAITFGSICDSTIFVKHLHEHQIIILCL